MFKKFIFAGVFSVFLTSALSSCKENAEKLPTTSQAKAETDIPKEYPRGVNQDWVPFESMAGKKPTETGLMKLPQLRERIKDLLKDEYKTFEDHWNEESPIVIEDRILFFTGCKAGDCKSNRFVVLLDVNDNNINLMHFKGGRAKSYSERYIIGLPSGLQKEYENIRTDQGL